MEINDFIFNAELEDIIEELRKQLHMNNIQLLQKSPRPTGSGEKASLQIQCPYHGNGLERKPSGGIRKSDGMYHCFACGEIHTLPEFISHCFGHTEDIAGMWGWKWLVRNFAAISVEERKDVILDIDRYTDVRNGGDNNQCHDSFITDEELDTYRYFHPYMYKRRLTDEIIEMFDIGYDKKTKCITFPIRDKQGNCLFIARRSVKTKFFNYPSGVEKPLYGAFELSQLNEYPEDIYVVESMLDALTIWGYGRYAVAMNGLGSNQIYQELNQLPCRHLILATDKDEAGMKARTKLREVIHNKIITEIDYFTYPDTAKDINDMTYEQFYALEEIF